MTDYLKLQHKIMLECKIVGIIVVMEIMII